MYPNNDGQKLRELFQWCEHVHVEAVLVQHNVCDASHDFLWALRPELPRIRGVLYEWSGTFRCAETCCGRVCCIGNAQPSATSVFVNTTNDVPRFDAYIERTQGKCIQNQTCNKNDPHCRRVNIGLLKHFFFFFPLYLVTMIELLQDFLGHDSWMVIPVAMWLTQLITYGLAGFFFTLVDLLHAPEAVYTWKLQTTPFKVEGSDKHPSLVKTIARVLLAFAFILPTLMAMQFLSRSVGLGIQLNAELPPVWRIAVDAVLLGLLAEVGFYFAHRTLHAIPWLYKNVHKQHHEFKTTVAIAATAAHPLEVVFGNTVAIQVWPFLLCAHPHVVLFGSVIGTLSTMYDHCGYWILGGSKWSVQPFFHDWHHEMNTGNFGFLGICDYLFGTDASWRREQRTRKVELCKRAAGMKVY
jgi:sterol desaturase/sphingolipid hydroxylase (fatty acid hydroxylase superfamily)